MTRESILSCQDVGKVYRRSHSPETPVLAGIDLDIKAGDFVTILGQSGSGKSTLLKILGGFTPPTSGSLLFHGQPLRQITPKIGMVFQENNLYPWLTVEQNIGFGFKIRGEKRSSYQDRVKQVMEHVGLSHAARRFPSQLSGGMKQRVAIARSIAVSPDVLLLDEPFSALDVQLRRRLQNFLMSIWKETATTMILVTHNVEEAILLGQRLIVVGGQPGHIIEKIDTFRSAFQDRYHPDFLQLQNHLESVIEQDVLARSGANPSSEPARKPLTL